jgi:hypothetical protein
MALYRLYFLDEADRIFARLDFDGRDAAMAVRIAAVVGEACSDTHFGYALWEDGREVYATDKDSRAYARGLAAAPLALDAQEIALDMVKRLLASRFSIAKSQRLLDAATELASTAATKLKYNKAG